MNLRNKVPLLLSLTFLLIIPVLAWRRFAALIGAEINPLFWPTAAFIVLYFCWLFLEIPVARAEGTKGEKTSDLGTCEIYAAGRALTWLSALAFSSPTATPLLMWLGLSIFIGGVAFRLWAIKTLGRFYSHVVRQVSGHQIIQGGPYRFVRHPAYTGMITAHLGIVLAFFNPVCCVAFCLVLVPAIALRIHIEEKTLYQISGYKAFARRRKKLVMGVW